MFIGAVALLCARPAAAMLPTPLGTVPPELSQAVDRGVVSLPGHALTGTSAVSPVWRLPIIMVSFSDDTLTYTPQDFTVALFDSTGSTPTGSLYDYYQWVSRGRLKVVGTVVARVRLPYDRYYYGYNAWGLNTDASPHNMWGAMRDALVQCDSLVDWTPYDQDHDGYVDMVWLLHAGPGGEAGLSKNDFWSLTSRMSAGWRYGAVFDLPQFVPGSTTLHMRVDRFSSVPELSAFHPGQRSEIGVFCHEFGHALGLPDLYDTSQLGGAANVGPGNWSLMSTGAYGTNGYTPESPSALDAWSMLFLGWTNSIMPADDATLVLPPLEDGGPVVQFWFQGEPSSELFMIENRQRLRFDQNLLSPGLLVYHVDQAGIGARLASNRINSGFTPGLQVVEADGRYDMTKGTDRGDNTDPFPGAYGVTSLNDDTSPSTRSFSGAVTNIGLSQIEASGTSMRFLLQVRAPGWLPMEDHTDALFNSAGNPSAGNTAVVDTFGTISEVSSENRAGIPQIVLRERVRGTWDAPITLSQSSLGAYEPTIAHTQNGDLGVAWRDLRSGTARIYYRARVGDNWTAEQPVGNIPANSFQPAIASDGQGFMHLTWLTAVKGRPRVMYMRFTYLSPFGMPVALTDSTGYPDAPTIAVDVSGNGAVLWPERALYPEQILFSRFRPDSLPSASLPIWPDSPASQVSVTAVMGADQRMRTLWLELGSGDATLHFQNRVGAVVIGVPDTTVEGTGAGILSPSLAVDPQGGVHYAFETTNAGVQEIRYKHWTPTHHWDYVSTEVTRPSDGSARQPRVLATSPDDATVLFTGYPSTQARFMSRDRRLGYIPATGVAAIPSPASLGLIAGPNPLRAGVALELRWAGGSLPTGANVDLFDIAGRRLATLALPGNGSARVVRIAPAVTASWPGGLYFARVRGTSAVARVVVLH